MRADTQKLHRAELQAKKSHDARQALQHLFACRLTVYVAPNHLQGGGVAHVLNFCQLHAVAVYSAANAPTLRRILAGAQYSGKEHNGQLN